MADHTDDFLSRLPTDLGIEILSRLSVQTIAACKLVRASWRDMIRTEAFTMAHIFNSPKGLAVFDQVATNRPYSVYEIVDEETHRNNGNCIQVIFSFDFPYTLQLHSSVHGLIFNRQHLCIFNPITQDYMLLAEPQTATTETHTFGFGASSRNVYKLVRISKDANNLASGVEVYTIGSGVWRIVPNCPELYYHLDSEGVCFNGHLYWLASNLDEQRVISILNLDTERFSSSPLFEHLSFGSVLEVFNDRLCLSLMDYKKSQLITVQMEESFSNIWVEIIGVPTTDFLFQVAFPTAVYANQDTVFVGNDLDTELRCYRNLPETIPEPISYRLCSGSERSCITYRPSFLACSSFQLENFGFFNDGEDA